MKKILIQYAVCVLAIALMVPLAQAQPAVGRIKSDAQRLDGFAILEVLKYRYL